MIHIFKTSVRTKNQVRRLQPHINQIMPADQWNFDLHDCDNILRIDSEDNMVQKITCLLNTHRFYCEELD